MRLAVFLVGTALALPAFAQLFDDNEARRRVELLRQQVEANRKAIEERLLKAEAAAQAMKAFADAAPDKQADAE